MALSVPAIIGLASIILLAGIFIGRASKPTSRQPLTDEERAQQARIGSNQRLGE